MGRKRQRRENKGLPKRWRYRFGAYYYRVLPGDEGLWDGKKEFKLGKTLPEAHRVWADRLELMGEANSIADIMELYSIKVTPDKALTTQYRELKIIKRITATLGHIPINALKPKNVNLVKTKEAEAHGPGSANLFISILSHAYTMAIEWGLCDRHPIKHNIKKYSIKPRDRYLEDWEFDAALTVASDFIAAYVPIKQQTGLRKGDVLSIKLADLKEDGIHVTQNKTGKRFIIEWTPELKVSVEAAKSISKKIGSMWLFHTNKGQPYIKEDRLTPTFNSIWQHWQNKAIEETDLVSKFVESDLRAKTASDTTEQHATDLLDHATSAVTKRHYRRKLKVVKPHSLHKK
ncbi:MAG: integrase [Proteobacteria bacterium]|nr:integrase [Pseudomonadota bacterium]